MSELLQILDDKNLHVHNIDWRSDRDVYKNHKAYMKNDFAGMSSPYDTHFIMHGSDVVYIGANGDQLHRFANRFNPPQQFGIAE